MRRTQITHLIPQPLRFAGRKLYFRGDKTKCDFCGTMTKGFRSHGGGAAVLDERKVVGGMMRTEDRCPVCHSADRTRLLRLAIETHMPVGEKKIRVLHVAPDFGLYLWLKKQKNIEYTGTDLDATRYRHIEGIKTADLTALPFDDDSFDLIICSHVLEHVPDDRKAFSELFRVLAADGLALLLTPYALDGKGTDEEPSISDPAEQDRRFGQWDHVRIYDRDDFLSRMGEAGFETDLFAPAETMPDKVPELHLNPAEKLPMGWKRVQKNGAD